MKETTENKKKLSEETRTSQADMARVMLCFNLYLSVC